MESNSVPRYIVDSERFYLNLNHPANKVFSSQTADNKIPVQLVSAGHEVKPDGPYPKWVQDAGVLAI